MTDRCFILLRAVLTAAHGMNQSQAKQELAALLTLCQKENIHVASVMHGIGKHILHAAADSLTPVTLELGGKSPAVVAAVVDGGDMRISCNTRRMGGLGSPRI